MAKKKQEESKVYNKFLTITQRDGTKKQLRFRGKTEKEAQAKLEKAKWECEQGLLVFNSNTTFARWAEEYMETYRKPNQLPGTYKDNESMLFRVFTCQIGHLRMCDIKQTHLQSCLGALDGKSRSYIHKNHVLIRGIFDKAMSNGIINRNPASNLEPPRGISGGRRALTEEERQAFMSVAQKHSKGLMFSVMLGCGLRPGEARALTWSNVNLKKNTITVTCTAERGGKNPKPPKSEAGYRAIPMPDWLAKMFAAQTQQDSLSYIFAGEDKLPMSEQRLKRGWDSFLRLMDIEGGAELYRNEVVRHSLVIGWNELTPYYLRHTYATGLAEAGVDIKTAQYLLGHADIKMTADVYTHVSQRMLDTARDKINLLYEAQKRTQTDSNH